MIMKGQKINDRYQIIKSIGEGGMANVYLAYDTILDRNVAVKVLRGDLSTDEKFVKRFQREALSASSLTHPNIVEVYDVGEDSGNFYIVMEYIEGKQLKQLIKKRGKLLPSEVVDIMTQVCEGLAVAHDSYIIHRDIKPQNIMILDSGLIKITDFGIAMALNNTQLTQTNSVMGSVHYLPPEQASGKGATIQSDIYSMGIMMYELLTGKLPFRGENAVEIALKQLKEPLPDIRDSIDVPNSIVNILKKCTAKNPKNRYEDAREMLEDIKTCMDESREDEPIIEYKYPEDLKLKPKTDKNEEAVEEESDEIITKEIDEETIKKENKLLLILGIVFTTIVIVITTVFVIIPKIVSARDVTIPDTTNLTEAIAEAKLKKAGLKIAGDNKEISSDDVKKGKVVKTSPKSGRVVKHGTEVTLYISTGTEKIKLDDYTGKNVQTIKNKLEKKDIQVLIEKKSVNDPSKVSANEVVAQDPEPGEEVYPGDSVTLYIPDIDELYPDFTNGDYTIKEVEKFADKYDIDLTIDYVTTGDYAPGTIISQSRSANSKIRSGASLTISVAKAPSTTVVKPDNTEEKNNTNETNTQGEDNE